MVVEVFLTVHAFYSAVQTRNDISLKNAPAACRARDDELRGDKKTPAFAGVFVGLVSMPHAAEGASGA